MGPAGTGKTHLLAAMYNALCMRPPLPSCIQHTVSADRSVERFCHRLTDQYAVWCVNEVEIYDPANEVRPAGGMKTLAAQRTSLVLDN